MRGVEVQGADIDALWLFDGERFLRVNGVDVIATPTATWHSRAKAAAMAKNMHLRLLLQRRAQRRHMRTQ